MWLFDSKAEIIGWMVSILVVAGMGVLAFTGPFHNINHSQASSLPAATVRIVSDPTSIGAYSPKVITLHLGQVALFKNVSNADHTVTTQDVSIDSGNIAMGATFVYTANKVGTYSYICSYHPLMHGTIVVVK